MTITPAAATRKRPTRLEKIQNDIAKEIERLEKARARKLEAIAAKRARDINPINAELTRLRAAAVGVGAAPVTSGPAGRVPGTGANQIKVKSLLRDSPGLSVFDIYERTNIKNVYSVLNSLIRIGQVTKNGSLYSLAGAEDPKPKLPYAPGEGPRQLQIKDLLSENSALSVAEIAKGIDYTPHNTKTAVASLVKLGQVVESDGKFSVPQ